MNQLFPDISPLPYEFVPSARDHGDTTLIVDANSETVLTIDSAAWDDEAELEHPRDHSNVRFVAHACNTYHPLNDLKTIMTRAIAAGRMTEAQLGDDFATIMETLHALGDAPVIPAEPIRYLSLSMTNMGVETDQYQSDGARQAWFDNQTAFVDDHYYIDIGSDGQLIGAGIANVGEHKIEDSAGDQIVIDISAVTPAMLKVASDESDLALALMPLQAAAGIDSGVVAAQVFSGPNARIWPTLKPIERLEALHDYLRKEHAVAGGQ